MTSMKPKFCKLLSLSLLLLPILLNAQDSLKKANTSKFGIEYGVNLGEFYGHSIGGLITIKEKHQLSLDLLLIPTRVFFGWNYGYGTGICYNFLPNKINNRLDIIFTASTYFTKIKEEEVLYYNYPSTILMSSQDIYSSIGCYLGLGFNLKISRRLNFNATLSSNMFTYYETDWIQRNKVANTKSISSNYNHYFINYEDFMLNDLLAKVSINYTF